MVTKNDQMNLRQAHKTVYSVVAGILLTVDTPVFARAFQV